jgi:hypothetical protein
MTSRNAFRCSSVKSGVFLPKTGLSSKKGAIGNQIPHPPSSDFGAASLMRSPRPATWPTTQLLQQHNHLQCAPKLKNSAPLGKGKIWEIKEKRSGAGPAMPETP